MNEQINSKALTPKLPATVEEFRALRNGTLVRTLNDAVEEIHLAMYPNEKYRGYLEAVNDSEAKEGSCSADNFVAASMIREYAKDKGRQEVFRQNLHTINLTLGVVLRRYNSTRKQRRNMLGGTIVPNGNSGAAE
jgi:hypothetical protein